MRGNKIASHEYSNLWYVWSHAYSTISQKFPRVLAEEPYQLPRQ